MTVITTEQPAREYGLDGRIPNTMITCNVHSALEGVRFMAKISEALAHPAILCKIVAGYHHDHPFDPKVDAEKAVEVLRDLASKSQDESNAT